MVMRRILGPLVLLAVLGTAWPAMAQGSGTRGWQRRLHIEVPLPVPVVELQPANPFLSQVDALPVLRASVPPRKLELTGEAVVAAHVNADGDCLGAVPLQTPFPGMTRALITECTDTRFEPARIGRQAVPSWIVLGMTMEVKVREGLVLDQLLELPDAGRPPVPVVPPRTYPSDRTIALPSTDSGALTSTAVPRSMRVRVSSRDQTVPMRLLLHVNENGRCDRFVPLEVDSGLVPWASAFLATWQLEPATHAGEPVACWLVYTARIQLELGTISSRAVRVLRERHYDPAEDMPPEVDDR